MSPGSKEWSFPGASNLPAITLSIFPPRSEPKGEQLNVMVNTTPGCISYLTTPLLIQLSKQLHLPKNIPINDPLSPLVKVFNDLVKVPPLVLFDNLFVNCKVPHYNAPTLITHFACGTMGRLPIAEPTYAIVSPALQAQSNLPLRRTRPGRPLR